MSELRCFCLIALMAVTSCTSSPIPRRASIDAAASPASPARRPASLDSFEIPVSEVHAECSREDARPQLFSTILALPGETVLMTAQAQGEWLTALRADGTECRAAVRCNAFVVQAKDMVWCVHARYPGPIADRYTEGPAEVELSYTRDSGMTWFRGRVDPSVIKVAAVGSPTSRGFQFVSHPGGELWRAEASSSSKNIHLWQMSPKAPGDRGADVALFAKSTFCVQRHRIDGEYSPRLFCRENEAGEWRDAGRSEAFYAASGTSAWWRIEAGGRLRRSALDPTRWEDVKDAADLVVHVMSQQGGAGGLLFAVASRGPADFLVGVDAEGRIVRRIPLGGLHVTALGAEGGVVAIAAAEGLFVLQGDNLREIRSLRGHLP